MKEILKQAKEMGKEYIIIKMAITTKENGLLISELAKLR